MTENELAALRQRADRAAQKGGVVAVEARTLLELLAEKEQARRLCGVRVIKHPDHRDETLFRLFYDGELVCNVFVGDMIADALEKRLCQH